MLVKSYDDSSFALDNFEGPLAFLLHLVQKSEISISEVSLRALIEQYIQNLEDQISLDINAGAEFISTTAHLMWMKSKTLLPAREEDEELDIIEETSPFAILPKLIEYCRFKELAKEFGKREHHQKSYYSRGSDPTYEPTQKLQGIEKISLTKLGELFQEVLRKSSSRKGLIREEVWRVKDKMTFLRQSLKEEPKILFKKVFSEEFSKEELIVTFLAVLEMMKLEELCIIQQEENVYVTQRNQNHE